MSADDIAISLRGVGKRFTKYEDVPALVTTLGGVLSRSTRSKLWAVRNIDLEVPRGGCLGVIGRNGAGKSTLLQMLCGVTSPTEGRVVVKGRAVPLISVGVGFHPELTGRDNVYVNATILGLTKRQIDERFDAIVDFAELGEFIDTPVKFYSSGMYVRLGFAVAVQIDPDVLLIDEVLAVGDLAFQLKCYHRLNEVRNSGTTVVFVTHNLNVVRQLCDQVMVLERGAKVYEGDADSAVTDFLDRLRSDTGDSDIGYAMHRGGIARISTVALLDSSRAVTGSVDRGDELTIRVEVEADVDVDDVFLSFAVHAEDSSLVYREHTYEHAWPQLRAGESAAAELRFAAALPSGSYTYSVSLHQREKEVSSKLVQFDLTPERVFHVRGRPEVLGVADLGLDVSVDPPLRG